MRWWPSSESFTPTAYDRDLLHQRPPTSHELNLLAQLREEQSSDEGSSADEGVPSKGAGWTSSGQPMRVGSGYTARDYCDGQALASPGRWPVAARRYLSSAHWRMVTEKYKRFSPVHGPPELLMNLALGRVKSCPCNQSDVSALKQEVVRALEQAGFELRRADEDRRDVPIDFRYLDLLLRAAEDPESTRKKAIN